MQATAMKNAVKRVLPVAVRRTIRRSIEEYRNRYATAFYDLADFPFTEDLEAHWREIAAEFKALEKDRFEAWPEDIYKGRWEVFGLYAMEKRLEENCRLCPVTASLMERIPGLTTAGFSHMMPGTHITPHTGYTRTVLRCHLGLVIPEDCAIRVGRETRHWEEGRCFVFDDTLEHEAWNRGASPRVVLLFDFVKPGQKFDHKVSEVARELIPK